MVRIRSETISSVVIVAVVVANMLTKSPIFTLLLALFLVSTSVELVYCQLRVGHIGVESVIFGVELA